MVGLIPRILLQTLETFSSAEVAAQFRNEAGLAAKENFKMGHAYSDDEWQSLLLKAVELTNWDRETLIKNFSDEFIRDAVQRWPMWFKMAKNSRQFLQLQPLIHNSFASGVVDPEKRRQVEDKFRLEDKEDSLVVHYRSPNHLCDLYIGLAKRLAQHYGDELELTKTQCQAHGDPKCEIRVRFLHLSAAASVEDTMAQGPR